MGSKNYTEAPDTGRHYMDKGGNARIVAEQRLIPRLLEKTSNAVDVDRHRMYFYARKLIGRRCSCWGVEDSADALCGVCLGKGVVGGFEKYGCHTFVLDVTHPNIAAVNVAPDFDAQTRPVKFGLLRQYNCTSGHIEFDLQLQKTFTHVDTFQASYTTKTGESSVGMFIKGPGDPGFVPLTKTTLENRLGASSVRVKITLARATPNSHLPTFGYLYIRCATRAADKMVILGDVPRKTRSIMLQEYGIQNSVQTISLWIPWQGVAPRTNDVFYDLEDSTTWKVVESQDNKPLGFHTSHDLQIAFVQDYQPEYRLPK